MPKSQGVNPLQSEPFYIMFGKGAGVSEIVDRDNRRPIPKYEPILILRGQDPAAIRAAYIYAELLTKEGRDAEAAKVRRQVEYMSNYRSWFQKAGSI